MPNDNEPLPPGGAQQPEAEPTARRFGMLLRDLRESYFTRIAGPHKTHGPAPQVKLSALTLIKCMRQADYPISSATYSLIESGASFPRNVNRFLDALRSCLQLSDADHAMLMYLLTYDLVYPRLGAQADNVLRPWSLLKITLSVWRGIRGLTNDELAHCLMDHGFVPAAAQEPDMLAMYLERMETGARWPFSTAEMEPFVAAYVRCVGDHAEEPLKKALAEELRLAEYIKAGTHPGKR
jgi:hypothetical protein